MATGEWSSQYDPTSVWASAYLAISNINYFLSLVNDVQWSWQDTVRNRLFRQRYTAEAHALRGYYYYRLLERNGGVGSNGKLLGVPIVNGVITSSDDWEIQRSSFDTTLMQALKDLNSGIAGLPYTYGDIGGGSPTPEQSNYNKVNGTGLNTNLIDGRITTAYKAKLYLLAASPSFNGGTNYNPVMLDSVVQILGKMITINGGLGSLAPDPIFWDNNNDFAALPGNPDILWRSQFSSTLSYEVSNFPPSLYGNGLVNPTQNLVDAFPMKNGYPITDPNSGYDPQNPYAGRDSRLDLMICRNKGSVRSGTSINTQADNTVNDDGLNHLALYSTRTGYYLKKLLRLDVNANPVSQSSQPHAYVRLRWTELFLSFAEAANELYGPDGDGGFGFTPRDIIGAIRARGAGSAGGGVDQPDEYLASITSTEGMRDLIRNERRIELSFEGFRFWDVRRWNVPLAQLTAPANGVSITGSPAVYDYTAGSVYPVEKRIYQSYMYHGPVPYLETKKYPGFIQNMGW